MKEDASVANCAQNSRPAQHRRNAASLAPPWGVQTCGSRKGRGPGCTAGVVGQSSTTEPIFLRLGIFLITQHPGYPSGRNFLKLQLVFDDGLHAPIADTKLLTNFNHSKPTIAFNKVTNRAMFSGVLLALGGRWWLVFCTASLTPRNSLCQNFTCVVYSVDSTYCARNLRQISLGPTFSLVRNFITKSCAIVIGTSLALILNSTNCEEGRVWRRSEEGLHSPRCYPIELIRWLQLTVVGLYLIYPRKSKSIESESSLTGNRMAFLINKTGNARST